MDKQHPFYKVKRVGRNQQRVQKSKNVFNSSNIRERQKTTSIHGFFCVNGLILLHSKTGKSFSIRRITYIKMNNTIHQKSFEKNKKYDTRGFKIID